MAKRKDTYSDDGWWLLAGQYSKASHCLWALKSKLILANSTSHDWKRLLFGANGCQHKRRSRWERPPCELARDVTFRAAPVHELCNFERNIAQHKELNTSMRKAPAYRPWFRSLPKCLLGPDPQSSPRKRKYFHCGLSNQDIKNNDHCIENLSSGFKTGIFLLQLCRSKEFWFSSIHNQHKYCKPFWLDHFFPFQTK